MNSSILKYWETDDMTLYIQKSPIFIKVPQAKEWKF